MDTDDGPADGLRVVVADGNHLIRRGLADVLVEAGAQVVGQAAEPGAALRAIADHAANVLVVGLEMARSVDHGHVVAIARGRWPDLAIVATSATPSDLAMLRAIELGASAYVARSASARQLVTTVVQAAAAPRAFLAEDLTASRRSARAAGPRLTLRESEVLRLAAEGLTVRGISARLFVSESTTRSHLAGIYRKLGVSTRSQAVLAAERLGMLA